MNPFPDIYRYLVFQPQVNLLETLYHFTGDTGYAIVILAVIVNLSLWPLFGASYVNSQKVKYLQPQMKALQLKYKGGNQQELIKETIAFNRKHGIKNSSIFLVLFAQIFFASGLYFVIMRVTEGKDLNEYLYSFVLSLSRAGFGQNAFGFMPLNSSVKDYIWLPILNAFLSFLYGMYTFKWLPKTALDKKMDDDRIAEKAKKELEAKKAGKEIDESPFDPEAITKSMEFNTIYVMPAFLFFFNFNLPAGLNIYFTTVSLLAFVRQFVITQYYKSHTNELVKKLMESDPENNDLVDLTSAEIPSKIIGQNPITEVEFVSKNSENTAKQKYISNQKKQKKGKKK